MIRLLYLVLILILCKEYFAARYRQEGAVVKYYNRKYLSECSAMTKREKRGQPYKTNTSCTTLHPWNNNVTLRISYGINGYPEMLKIESKFCDIVKIKWLINYMRTYTNDAEFLRNCPLAPGTYGLYNMELPPKDFPFPLPSGDLFVIFIMQLTDTKEILSEFHMLVRVA